MSLRAGPLNQRVQLQRPAAGVDALGQALDDWETAATVWARVEPIRGSEYFAAAQIRASAQVRIIIRQRFIALLPIFLWISGSLSTGGWHFGLYFPFAFFVVMLVVSKPARLRAVRSGSLFLR